MNISNDLLNMNKCFFYNLSYLFKLYNTVFEPGSIINWLTLMSKFYIKFHSLFYLSVFCMLAKVQNFGAN